MPEYQITYWRDLPSLVVVRDGDGDDVTKAPLPPRFQEAIDDAAMRLGDVSSDDYLAGWRRSDWTPADGTPAAVADDVVARLESDWEPSAVATYLDTIAERTSRTSQQTAAGGDA